MTDDEEEDEEEEQEEGAKEGRSKRIESADTLRSGRLILVRFKCYSRTFLTKTSCMLDEPWAFENVYAF